MKFHGNLTTEEILAIIDLADSEPKECWTREQVEEWMYAKVYTEFRREIWRKMWLEGEPVGFISLDKTKFPSAIHAAETFKNK